jgi:hypothetical protein
MFYFNVHGWTKNYFSTEEQDVMRDELDFYGTEKFGI